MKEAVRWILFIIFCMALCQSIFMVVFYYITMIPASENRYLALAGVYALIAIATKPEDDGAK